MTWTKKDLDAAKTKQLPLVTLEYDNRHLPEDPKVGKRMHILMTGPMHREMGALVRALLAATSIDLARTTREVLPLLKKIAES